MQSQSVFSEIPMKSLTPIAIIPAKTETFSNDFSAASTKLNSASLRNYLGITVSKVMLSPSVLPESLLLNRIGSMIVVRIMSGDFPIDILSGFMNSNLRRSCFSENSATLTAKLKFPFIQLSSIE